MKQSIILVFIFAFNPYITYGQQYYYKVNKTYDHSVTNTKLIEVGKRKFLFASGLCENYSCEELIEINEAGDYLWQIKLDNIAIAPQTCFFYQDTFFITGRNSPANDRTVIYKVSIKDTITTRHEVKIETKYFDLFNGLNSLMYNNTFILSGQAIKEEKSYGAILVLNRSLEIDTILMDNNGNYTSILIESKVGPDSLLTCFYHQVNKDPAQVRRIEKYDADFRQVWSYTSDTLLTNFSYPNGTVLFDGRVVYVDYKPTWPSGLDGLRCLDTLTKQTSWRFDYSFQPSWGRKLRSVKQLKNGDIICTGDYTTKATTPRIEGSPYMMRLDSRGFLKWERAFVEIAPDGEDKGGNLWDVIELDNGDLMTVGFVTNDHKWTPIIIHTDADGCIDQAQANCPTVQIIDLMSGEVDVIGESPITIHPNPASNYITISAADPGIYVIYNFTGQRMLSGIIDDEHIDVSSLSSGQYLIKTTNKNGVIKHHKFIKE